MDELTTELQDRFYIALGVAMLFTVTLVLLMLFGQISPQDSVAFGGGAGLGVQWGIVVEKKWTLRRLARAQIEALDAW